jgi:hypothetical protein
VQVYGRATIYHDTKDEQTELFLRQQLGDLAPRGGFGLCVEVWGDVVVYWAGEDN